MKSNLISPRRVLKVSVSCVIAKPLNGTLPRSNTSHLLRLYPVGYSYKNRNKEVQSEIQTYHLKGIRGAIRHAVMGFCHDHGVEICHTTDKETTKDGTPLLPSGFHLLGHCAENGGSCLVHDLFGSMRQEGHITVYAPPIASPSQKTAQLENIQPVHIATEHRICQTFDNKTAQEFGERYFSGDFTFEVDTTNCSPRELGLLINSIMTMNRLGAGYNAGYGHIKVKAFLLVNRVVSRQAIWGQDEEFQVQEKIAETSLKTEVLEAFSAWEEYIAAHS
ncbi:MAG: hypothetical protein ACE5OZ_01730 [Candidatus Heimdallarchaeota archaeon]